METIYQIINPTPVPVVSLPMRDGNTYPDAGGQQTMTVVSLPMRDGNIRPLLSIADWSLVVSLPMRDGNAA